jgi:hypothetical protein
MGLLRRRDAQGFGDRSQAAAALVDCVFHHRGEARSLRRDAQGACVNGGTDKVADLASDLQGFEDADAPSVAYAAATLAASRRPDDFSG